jgi:hypothetical protein
MKMQYVTPKRGVECIHVETELGIVNIYLGLHDSEGRKVESIEILADDYAGEPKVTLDGHVRSRLIQELPKEEGK